MLVLVQRRRGLYVSDDALARRTEQNKRNRALLDSLTAINELGQEFSLADLAAVSVSNREIRRAELMTRISGFEYIAVGLGMAGEFVTITAPSRYHARREKSGQRNPKFDGSTPTEASRYLGGVWQRITAALDRAGVRIFGFRVAEPHHDGTPHYHCLFFVRPEHVDQFRQIVARYAVRENRDELGLRYVLTQGDAMRQARAMRAAGAIGSLRQLADAVGTEAAFWSNPPRGAWRSVRARVFFKAIHWSKGTATGYIAKYICKNIDGKTALGDDGGIDYESAQAELMAATARRVDAWASTWGIRQFQQVGGPPVGIWRELRRWDYAGADDVLASAAFAADKGDWGRFVSIMGGHEKRRREMPLAIAKDETPVTNRYGEASPPTTCGVLDKQTGELAISRMHEWTVRSAGGLGREAAPWTCVNNSTFSTKSTISPIQSKPATDADIQRWQADYDEQVSQLSIQPLDVATTPEWRARQQQLITEQKQIDAWRAAVSVEDWSRLVDSWANSARDTAREYDEYNRLLHQGIGLYQSLAKVPGRGLEVLEDMRQRKEAADRFVASEPPPRRRRASNAPSLSEQLASAVRDGRRWIDSVRGSGAGL